MQAAHNRSDAAPPYSRFRELFLENPVNVKRRICFALRILTFEDARVNNREQDAEGEEDQEVRIHEENDQPQ